MTQKKKSALTSKVTKPKKKQPLTVDVELQQRQQELELINKQLAVSRAELEAALGQYTDLYDFAPVGYFTLTRDGTIRESNLAGEHLLRVKRTRLINQRLEFFVSSKSLPTFSVFFDELLSGEGKKNCELALKKRGSELLWIRLEATCFEGSDVCRAVLTDITERKLMEQVLQESENRFRTTLQDVPNIAVQGYAQDGTTQYWNSASEKLYGYSAQEAIGQNLLDLIIPPEMQSGVRQAIQQMAETGQPIPAAELSLMRKDGSRVSVYSSHTVFSVPGHTAELFCLDVDLTERKQAEKALRESENRYRALIEFAVDGILVGSHEGLIIDANSYMLYLTGRTLNNLIGIHISELFNPGELKNSPFQFDRLKNGETIMSERNLARPDGKVIPIEMHTKMMPDGTYQSIYRDITERKRAEELLKESEWRNRIVSELTADYIFVVDVNPGGILKLRWASDNMFRMTGRTIEDAATSDLWGSIIHPGDQSRFFGFINQVLSTAKAGELECRTFYKHGGERWIHIHVRPQIGKENSVTTIVGAIDDITERKQAEEALRESQELFSLFMLHSPIYTFIKDVTPTESRVLQASDNYQEMIGISGTDMIGKTMQDLFPPEPAAKFTADDWDVVTTGQVLKLDEDLNGRHYTTIKFPIIQGDKTLLAGYTIDITERVRAETTLKDSEFFVKGVLNSLTAHIAVLNNQGVIIAVNEAWTKFAHENNSHDSTDYVGVNYLSACQPAIQQGDPIARQVDQGIRAVLDGTQSQFNLEYPCHAPNQKRWFILTALPMHQSHQGVVVIHQNITESKRAELELQYMKEGLEKANIELQTALAREKLLAHTDALTGINNRRNLYKLAEHEFEIATRYHKPLSVIMFDIDHFKEVNDTFGHAVGDQILQYVTQAARVELRSADVIGRYGGEEFVIVLPMTNAKQAYPLAERIRTGVAAIRVPTEKGDASVTLSIGIVEIVHGVQNGSAEDLIRRADKTMYAAKQAGRSRTEIGE